MSNTLCASLVRHEAVKIIGKPYAGKPHLRFDEGEGQVYSCTLSTLPVKCFIIYLKRREPLSKKTQSIAENRQLIKTRS